MTEVTRFSEDDYNELRRFIGRTPRGRAFLREHERRAQKLAAEEVIRLINDLRDSWRKHSEGVDATTQVEVLRRELLDMSASIIQARREIASLRPKEEAEGNDRIMTATNELDAIVQSTERASFEILNAAERIMDLTGKLRTAGAAADLCNDIDTETSNIFTACSFQDLTGQRTTKVVNALRYIEQRVTAMMSIWGPSGAAVRPVDDRGPVDSRPDAHLLNGPSDNGVNQDEIDRLLGGVFAPADSEAGQPPDAAPQPAPAKAAAPAPVAAPASNGGNASALGQNDIDSLFD